MSRDINSLSEEDFDAEFEKFLATPVESGSEEEESDKTDVPEQLPDDSGTEEEEEEDVSEQPEDDVEEEEEDEGTPSDEAAEDDETEDSDTPDDFDAKLLESIPMDVILPIEIPANGMKVKATMSELIAGFQKGMNYTQKMQELAPLRRSIGIMRDNGLSESDLNLLIEAKSGNKAALSKLLSIGGVDSLDLDADEHKDYQAKDHGKDEPDLDYEAVRNEIISDVEVTPVVNDALQTMPDDMYEVVNGNAFGMKALYQDIKAGVYQKVMPEVIKLQTLHGKIEPTKDTYIKIAHRMAAEEAERAQGAQKPAPKTTQADADRRKRAMSTTKTKGVKESFIEKDLKTLSDEEFDKEFAKVIGRSVNEYK